jgi:hypothetical protein
MLLDWTVNTVPSCPHTKPPHHHSISIAYILSGAVIPIWPIIQHELDNSKYIQIVRCIVGKGAELERVVGLEIKAGVQHNIVQAINEFKTLHQVNDEDDEALARRLQAEEVLELDDEGGDDDDEEGGGRRRQGQGRLRLVGIGGPRAVGDGKAQGRGQHQRGADEGA